jgi:hypothetical protein
MDLARLLGDLGWTVAVENNSAVMEFKQLRQKTEVV